MKLETTSTLQPTIVSLVSEGDLSSRFNRKLRSSSMDITREESPTPRDVLITSSFVDVKASKLTINPELNSKLFPSQDSSNDFGTSDSSESSESGLPSLVLPEDKLYGRETEQASLSDVFQRITQAKAPKKLDFVLISGPSGTGKSKLAQSLQERVQAEGGYFCSGKFDQLNQAHPLSPLVAAFNDYVQQIIAEGAESIKHVREALLREVDSDLWIVAKVMPAIADLVGKENVMNNQYCHAMSAAKHGACAGNAIKKMMRAISSPEKPLVLMLDDLQWATQTPLRKLRAMVTDPLNDGVLFLATCRDDVASNSDLSSFLRELEDDEVQISNIALSNLSYPVIAEMLQDKVGLPAAESTAMSEFVFKRSDGNIFFVFEIIQFLRDSKVLTCDKETMLWSIGALPTCQFCNHSGFIDRKLGMLTRAEQKVLMVASCLGANVTQELMEIALHEKIEDPLALVVKKRLLVVDDNQETYSFSHDRIQAAAYSLIEDELKPAFHLEIGRRLWKHLGDKELDDDLFVVLSQLEKGTHIIRRDKAMIHEIAGLCIRAAEKSVALSSFHVASERLSMAMTLLGDNCWEEAYDLSLVLYNHAAEVEVSIGNHDRVEALLKKVLDNAKSFSDQLRAYSTQVYVLGVQGKMNLAIKTGFHVLEQLGEGEPAKFSKIGLYWNMASIGRKLRRKTNRNIRRLPHMTDPKKIAAMQILNMLFLNTFLARPDMFPFVVVKMMKLTLTDGLSAISAVAFAGYGTMMAYSGRITQGLKYGQVSLDILDDFEATAFLPRCYAFVYGLIRPQAMPWSDALEPLKLGHSVGLRTGDLEFATVNAQFHILFLVDIGQVPLPGISRRLSELRDANEMHGHQMGILKPMVGALDLVSNPHANMLDHSGGIDDGMNDATANGNSYALSFIYCLKSFAAIMVEDHVACLEYGDKHMELIDRHTHTIHDAFWMFLDGLSAFARARHVGSKSEKQRLVKRGKNGIRSLKKLSKTCPTHSLSKFILLEAELEAVAGNHVMAEEKFSHALSLARKYENKYEQALCNQVAGNHYITDLNQVEEGIKHLRAAIDNFEAWGALATVTHLKGKIEKLETSPKRR